MLRPRRSLDRATAWGCLTSNLLVLPGLGSLVAGRKTGYAQAFFALSGLVLSAVFATWFFKTWFGLQVKPATWEELKGLLSSWTFHLWLGGLGVSLFLIGWLWALCSSIGILSESTAAPAHFQ